MQVNPKGKDVGMYRVFRGGSCVTYVRYGRASCSCCDFPKVVSCRVGFRVMLGVSHADKS